MESTIDISDARKQLNNLAAHLKEDRVIVVTRHSKKAFAVVDLKYLETLLETLEILSDPDPWRCYRRASRTYGQVASMTTTRSRRSSDRWTALRFAGLRRPSKAWPLSRQRFDEVYSM
jgi:PHD/YefM family antitoxin component YafN of YafNO toxin-antitoxin module